MKQVSGSFCTFLRKNNILLPQNMKTTTYKLKLNHGDLKATQGDTGHAEIDMITKVYAHILDEDRKINAQKFECAMLTRICAIPDRPSRSLKRQIWT